MSDTLDQAIDQAIDDMLLELVDAKATVGTHRVVRRARLEAITKCAERLLAMRVIYVRTEGGHRPH